MFEEIPISKRAQAKKTKVYGIGNNDADYFVSRVVEGKRITCPYFSTWKNMLERCYSKPSLAKRPYYKGCTVCKEWLTFSNFKSWMEKQDWEDKQLDKDIIEPYNKIYSPDTCIFVTCKINNILKTNSHKRGKYPIGVFYSKRNKKYLAQCQYYEKKVLLGSFTTPEEASQAYNLFKYKYLKEVAMCQKDPKLKKGLLVHAQLFREGKVC